jgi:hypothetical protein
MRNLGIRHIIPGLVAAGALLGLTACTGTRLSDVWRDPNYTAAPFHQVP